MPDDGKIIMCQIREKIFYLGIFCAIDVREAMKKIIALKIERENMFEILIN